MCIGVGGSHGYERERARSHAHAGHGRMACMCIVCEHMRVHGPRVRPHAWRMHAHHTQYVSP